MKTMKKCNGKLLSILLVLCMVLSIVPITAFAEEVENLEFLPQGVTRSTECKNPYHTQVNVTANVTVKGSDGTVIETTQVSKSSGDFVKGNLTDEAVETALANLQTEIETPYKAKGTVTRENGSGQLIVDHFESETFYIFTPTSGDPVDFSTNLDAAKQYFSEHTDAVGTFTRILDVHEYRKWDYTYDLNVQKASQPTNTIPAATIENAKFNYQPGDAPQATAWVAIDDMDKYEIAYECWQQFENNEPVAAWYSDNGSHGSLPTITAFESGKSYVYSLMLKPKDGYSFSSETVITVNGKKVSAPFVGGSMYIPAIKTITMPTIKVIDVVEINGATVSFKDGDKPVFTGDVPDDVYYVLRAAWWELNSTTGLISTEPEFGSGIYENKITTFEAGKTYHYGVYVVAYGDVGNIRYIFGPDTKLKINGEFVNYTRYEGDESNGSDGTMWVLTDLTMTPTTSSHTHSYGTDWKSDADTHWHECSCGSIADKAAHDMETKNAKDATATEKGYTGDKVCKVCGYTVKGEEIPATGNTNMTKPNGNTNDNSNMQNDGKTTESPKTGDESNLILWFVVLFASIAGVIGTVTYGRKKKCVK